MRDGETRSVTPDPFELQPELSAADYFAEHYGCDFRYCERAGGWFAWRDGYWSRDSDGLIFGRAAECTRRIAESADTVGDLEARPEEKLRTAFDVCEAVSIEDLERVFEALLNRHRSIRANVADWFMSVRQPYQPCPLPGITRAASPNSA